MRKTSWTKIEDDLVLVGREYFDAEKHLSRGETTMFYRQEGEEGWRRHDSTSWDRFYSAAELAATLSAVGFTGIRLYDRDRDLGVGEAWNRTYVVATKPGGVTTSASIRRPRSTPPRTRRAGPGKPGRRGP